MKSKSYVWSSGKWNKEIELVKNSENTLIMLFGNDLPKILELIDQYKNYNIIGSTTAGNISSGQFHEVSQENSTVTLTVLEFESTKVKIHTQTLDSYESSFFSGKTLFNKLNETEKLSGSIFLTEGLLINGAKFSAGINEVNSKKVPVIGGLAADNMEFEQTFVFSKDGALFNTAIAVGFYGEKFKMFMDSKSGIDPFGIERKITKSEKNILFELDGKPALDIYEDYLGEKAKELPQAGLHFPVEICENFEKKEGLVRTPIAINRESKSIIFTGEIPQNEYLRLMIASRESLAIASEDVGASCISKIPKEKFESKKYFNFLISCAGRRAVFGADMEDELLPTFELTNYNQDNSVGFYSYGEIISLNNECCLVNQTMSQCVFFED